MLHGMAGNLICPLDTEGFYVYKQEGADSLVMGRKQMFLTPHEPAHDVKSLIRPCQALCVFRVSLEEGRLGTLFWENLPRFLEESLEHFGDGS